MAYGLAALPSLVNSKCDPQQSSAGSNCEAYRFDQVASHTQAAKDASQFGIFHEVKRRFVNAAATSPRLGIDGETAGIRMSPVITADTGTLQES